MTRAGVPGLPYAPCNMAHILWDWNGTLFDDLDAVVEATNEIFVSYGLPPLDPAGFRAVYTRPIWACYERLLGRPLHDGEWERLDTAFHDSYHRLMERCELAADARQTLGILADAGHTQSLLSMWRHDRLGVTVRRHGIGEVFRRVDGLRPEEAGGSKTEFMVRHMYALGLLSGEPPSERSDGRGDASPLGGGGDGQSGRRLVADVIVVGDSVDDALAARHVGARAVLYAGGMQGRAELERLGVPVIDRLADLSMHI